MTINCSGRLSVTTPGMPIPVSADPAVRASKLFFQAIPGLTGKTYVGTPGLTRATLAGCARVLSANPAGSFSETFFIEAQDGENSIRLADYVVDADVAGEGLLVTYWTE